MARLGLDLTFSVSATCKRCGADVDPEQIREVEGMREIGEWGSVHERRIRQRIEYHAPGLCGCGGHRVVVVLAME